MSEHRLFQLQQLLIVASTATVYALRTFASEPISVAAAAARLLLNADVGSLVLLPCDR